MTAASFHPGSDRSPSILIGEWIFGSDSVGGTGSSCSAAKRRGAHSTARRTSPRGRIERSLRVDGRKVAEVWPLTLTLSPSRGRGDLVRSSSRILTGSRFQNLLSPREGGEGRVRGPPPSPEIVARHPLELGDRPEALRADRHRAVLRLEPALDDERARSDDDRALFLEEVGPDDRLHHPRLVLE